MSELALACHFCGSLDLILREVIESCAEYDGGLYINEAGDLAARGEAVFTRGDPVPSRTRIECNSCGDDWHPRRTFVGVQG